MFMKIINLNQKLKIFKNLDKNIMSFFKSFHLFSLLEYLILALVPALLIGPLIAEIILFISIIVYLRCINKEKKTKIFFFNNKLIYFFLFFYLYFFINSLISSTPIIISFKIFFFLRFIFLLIIIDYILLKNENFLISLSKIILTTFIILFIDALIQKITGINIFGLEKINNYRISSFFGDELVMGGFIARFSPLLLFGYFLFKNKKLQKLSAITFLISFYFILLSGERAALVSALISLLYCSVFLEIEKKIILKSFVIIITLLTLVIASDTKVKTRIITHYLEQTSHSSQEANILKKYIPIQLINLFDSTPELLEKNGLIGLGPYSFRYYCNQKIQEKPCKGGHPHNSYLQLLIETGYLGLLYFLIPFLFISYFQLRMKFKKNKNRLNYNLFTLSSCLVFIIIWPINQNGNIFNNWLNISYYLSFAIYIYFLKKNYEFINNWR